ncbi:hypothetical protein BGX23_009060 [Mortierella sp. AD031]|nr:hypothetical protein BGX23_009060 [Mortierella sp. AD031]
MKFPFLKKKQLSRKKQQAIPSPPSQLIVQPVAPSPLIIPEILERIFSHVDEFTLRKTVALVCRLWFQMNRHFVLRELVWDTHVPAENIDKVLSKLAGAGRVRWFCDWGMPTDASWDKFMRALLDLQDSGTQLQRQQQPMQFNNTLRKLELRCKAFAVGNQFDAIPFPPSLTSFKFTVQKGRCSFSLGRFLEVCPLLEEFHGETATDLLVLRGSMVPSHDGERDRHRFLPLRSLVLRHAVLNQSSLEALLSLTPRIQELKLIGLKSEALKDKYSRAAIVQHVQSLPIMLHSFHFSVFDQIDDGPEANDTILSPMETGRSFWAFALSPPLMRTLDEAGSFVTTLELYWRHSDGCDASSWLLHRFMCQSYHLLHVRTTNVAFQFEHMDLHRRAPIGGTPDTVSIQTGVWACSNLRTLHLELHGHGKRQLIQPVTSRIVFGYISTVCPRLQDLQLIVPRMCKVQGRTFFNKLVMRLPGGFILLSRLKHLERLYVGFEAPDCERTHVNWMVPSGRTPEFRAKRREMVANWKTSIQEEQLKLKDPAEITRLSLMDKDVLRWGELETQSKRELWRLGLLLEVKKMVEQMDTDDFQCWPLLHRVSLNGGFEQGPESCVRNLFPRM